MTEPEAPELDIALFLRLMDLAGPDTAPELLARVDTDLRAVGAGLRSGFRGHGDGLPDWEALRAQSHVLIAVAGVLGATRLQRLAETLNRQAHGTDATGLAAMAPEAARLLDSLLGSVARYRDSGQLP